MREQVDINVCFWLFPCYQQSISFIFLILNKVKLLSHVQLFATPWIVAYQVSPSMGSSRQEYWSGLPFPSPGILILKYTLNNVLLLLTVFFFFFKALYLQTSFKVFLMYSSLFYILSTGELTCSSCFCVVTLKAIPQCFQVANYVNFLLPCNKLTQIQWLKTLPIYNLTVPQVRSLEWLSQTLWPAQALI